MSAARGAAARRDPVGKADSSFQDFHDLRAEFSAYEGVSTEDVLAAALPLMRQVAETHEVGRVAPLDGVEALRVHKGRLWFEDRKSKEPSRNGGAIESVQGGALELGGAFGGNAYDVEEHESLRIGMRGQPPKTPVFLPDYRSWEHAVLHHDPLTDIFSLGMIAASLATGLDFTEPAQLAEFAANRERLHQLNRRLHPVAAQILMRMTELDRRRRAQDLPDLIRGLENHRRIGQSRTQDKPEKKLPREQQILDELRGRLYDMSRRNKLLFHKPSTAELNLTEASTPIVLRVSAIREEQLFTWTSHARDQLMTGEPMRLSEYLRIEEMPHVTPTLMNLLKQANRDKKEFGRSQLRLVAAFLRWRNLKDAPEEPISSPLLLIPVELKKVPGVRDQLSLRALSNRAEVNPTLRRYLSMLYRVELPDSVDLEDPKAIDALHRNLAEQIADTEPGVRLEKIDRPQIRLMHERARRRADLFKRRSRPTGPGARNRFHCDYSYNPTGFRPLGDQLFHRYVRPAEPPKHDFAGALTPAAAAPRAAAEMAPREGGARRAAAQTPPPPYVHELVEPGTENELVWAFDLCSVTLANFNYRKMSLVRDYDELLAEEALPGSPPFEQLFSDGARPLGSEPETPPLGDRHQVVISDPTQEAAVHRARSGESFVIQGPPGTGKSQTIANLVADFIGRGKRVLFVCEKRAALDVVHHRLRGLGLHRLCALVHDSQEDRRPFIQDVKALYDSWRENVDQEAAAAAQEREEAALRALASLSQLEALDEDMTSVAEGEPMHKLATLAAAKAATGLAPSEPMHPTRGGALAPLPGWADLLPTLADWREGREAAQAMAAALTRIGSEPILARHPARFVSASASGDPQLFERLTAALNALKPHLERMNAAAELAIWTRTEPAPLGALFAQIDYAHRLSPVAAARKLAILDPDSYLSNTFNADARLVQEARESLTRAEGRTRIWNDKLSPVETERALMVARAQEGKLLSFMSSAWRQVKAEVAERAGFKELAIQPRVSDVLADLAREHEAAEERDRVERRLAALIGLKEGDAALRVAEDRDAGEPREGRFATPLMDLAREASYKNAPREETEAAIEQIQALAKLKPEADAARAAISECFEGLDALPAVKAFAALAELEKNRDALPAFAPALRALSGAPEAVRSALRTLDLTIDGIEAAVLDRAVERAMVVRPALREMTGFSVDETSAKIADAMSAFRKANAKALLLETQARFARAVRASAIGGKRAGLGGDLFEDAAQAPSAEDLAKREAYAKGRAALEKSNRNATLRDLMSGDAGPVIADLKPVWLMSPLSVADVLPLAGDLFDVAIFDEASQVSVEDAAPTLFRAPQVIVVGDEKQLPPTNFFGSGPSVDADEIDPDDAADELDLRAESFLGQAAKSLPSTLLGWHYRSRSEALIAFSNAVFYGGKLISVPSVRRLVEAPAVEAQDASEGKTFWREVVARPVSFHHTPFGVYESQRNGGEAAYIAEMVRGLLLAKPSEGGGQTIGVVAFSEAQQSEIERALEDLAKIDAKFAAAYEKELEREEDGQFAGLFVKNLENVQGDERDVIIVSVCYAPDSVGKMRMNFGPINRAGGEKRLNVIFSRAKAHIALVSSIKADRITNDYNTGALCLKTYLRYAEAVSKGDAEAMRRALASVAPHAQPERSALESPVASQIAAALRERGYEVDLTVGESKFICDLAVRRPESDGHELAVLIDGPAHYANRNVLERHVVKPGVLQAFGWQALTVLSLDWRRDREGVLKRIERALPQRGRGARTVH